jgi:hypothetical protein
MRGYELELLSGDGSIERSVQITCVDDDEALLRAAALAHPHAVIVREGLRRVGDIRDGLIVPRVTVGS